ncbi:unnamed protein product [Dicrocoelium dendriticum]|nr:unnamed protein product [Dicrocoelium dendriticum]
MLMDTLVDRRRTSPVWMKHRGLLTTNAHLVSETQDSYQGYPTVRYTRKSSDINTQGSSAMRYPADDLILKATLSSETGTSFVNPESLRVREPRRLCRRRDMIQLPPEGVQLEDKTHYRVCYNGQVSAPAVPARFADEGGNETQRVRRKTPEKEQGQGKSRLDVNDLCYAQRHVTTNRSDFVDFKMRDRYAVGKASITEERVPVLKRRDEVHTWVPLPVAPDVIVRTGYEWKPKPAVHIPKDAASMKPMEDTTCYRQHFKQYSREAFPEPLPANIRAKQSEIGAKKLLGSRAVQAEATPKTVYQDSYVGQQEADRWADRGVRQNISAVVQHTGCPYKDDYLYWSDIPTDPFTENLTPIFRSTETTTLN